MKLRLGEKLAGFLPAGSRLKRALDLVSQEKYGAAFALLAPLAREGDAEAQYQVGRAYLRGAGVPPDKAQGLKWLERAAEQNHAEAAYTLASLAAQGGLDVPQEGTGLFGAGPQPAKPEKLETDWVKAAYWAERAGDRSPGAQALLAYILTSGPEEMRDKARALELYRASADAGCPQGQLGVAFSMLATNQKTEWAAARPYLEKAAEAGLPLAHYLLGLGAERGAWGEIDLKQAADSYAKSAAGGARQGMARWGLALLEGKGVAKDPVTGETWLRRAGHLGDAEAAAIVADIYARPGDLPPNFAEAAIWLRIAAENGHRAAARSLGMLYVTGTGVGRDLDLAAEWFRRAAAAGDADARVKLAGLALQGAGDEEDRLRSREWFEAAARGGDPVAAFNFGVCLAEGVGIAHDDAEALAWFRKAADTVVQAQYWLGRMLSEGRGAAKDEAEARRWMTQAADAGSADAQVGLAEMLVNGRGGEKDHPAALALFRKAAEAGHAGGAFGLAAMLGGGHEVPESREEAFLWFSRAAAKKHPHAQLMMGRYLAYGAAGRTDLTEAAGWLRKARAQGLVEAETDLQYVAAAGGR